MTVSGVNVVVAFGGGVASFASPCVLPLVPAYLSVIAGLDIARRRDPGPALARVGVSASERSVPERQAAGEPESASERRLGAVTRDAALFVGGFGVVFVLLGLSASALGRAVIHHQGTLTRVSGVVVVAMSLFLAGSVFLRTPAIYGEWRPHPRLARFGPVAAPVAGAAFAFGWTPCVGPVLASVLALSSDQGRLTDGALLLAVYSLGLGVPFLAVAVFFDRLRGPMAWLRRHGTYVTLASAAALGVLGVLLVVDRLAWVTSELQSIT